MLYFIDFLCMNHKCKARRGVELGGVYLVPILRKANKLSILYSKFVISRTSY